MIQDPHADPDHHQKLTTSRGSPLAHAYHVWLTSVSTFMSYPAHRMTDRQTDRIKRSHNPASLFGVKTITKLLFDLLQLRSRYSQTNDGGASAVEEMSSALDAAERSCPGFIDSFVAGLIDGMIGSSLHWAAIDAAIQKTKR